MTQPLVSTAWVAEHLEDQHVRIVQINVDTSYNGGHLPGAIILSWESQLQDTVVRDIVSQSQFESLMQESGISPSTHVVLYGDHHNWFAAYGFWLFRYYGHRQLSLMDGGLKKWLAEGRSTTSTPTAYPTSNYKVAQINETYRANRQYVQEQLKHKMTMLVDVRSPAEYSGELIAPTGMTETALRGGHIPGAANIPWRNAIAADGTFKDKSELAALYGAHGINGNITEIITYCRIGERSSHTWFVLKEILQYDCVRNYDGSWTEWGNLVGMPIKTGNER